MAAPRFQQIPAIPDGETCAHHFYFESTLTRRNLMDSVWASTGLPSEDTCRNELLKPEVVETIQLILENGDSVSIITAGKKASLIYVLKQAGLSQDQLNKITIYSNENKDSLNYCSNIIADIADTNPAKHHFYYDHRNFIRDQIAEYTAGHFKAARKSLVIIPADGHLDDERYAADENDAKNKIRHLRYAQNVAQRKHPTCSLDDIKADVAPLASSLFDGDEYIPEPEPLFQWGMIAKYTLSFAIGGATGGATCGTIMGGAFGAITSVPSLGTGIFVFAGIGAVVGAVGGFIGGAIAGFAIGVGKSIVTSLCCGDSYAESGYSPVPRQDLYSPTNRQSSTHTVTKRKLSTEKKDVELTIPTASKDADLELQVIPKKSEPSSFGNLFCCLFGSRKEVVDEDRLVRRLKH